MRKVNFIFFPSNSPGKARAVFKMYLGVRCQLRKKKTDYSCLTEWTDAMEEIHARGNDSKCSKINTGELTPD